MKNLMPKNMSKQMINQQGAVLVLSLLMLFVLTLIGVSSINTTSMEEKMSGNARNRHLAFQAAEAAISEAEQFIVGSVSSPATQFTAGGTGGLYTLGNGPSSGEAVTKTWWTGLTTTQRAAYASTLQDTKSSPLYVIEFLGQTTQEEANDVEIFSGGTGKGGSGTFFVFRITARGTGLTDNSVVVIQSHFGKRI